MPELRLPPHRYPAEPWKLTEIEYSCNDLGVTETNFALGNGYLGMRANPEEGRDSHTHGTFLNGFHEVWDIQHAESAYGFARTGQTIINVPDAKVMKIYVDDEPLILNTAELEEYSRELDFKTGLLKRSVIWRTPAGKRVRVVSTRMVSFEHRHLAVMTQEIEILDSDAPVVVSSQLLNRQDGGDEYDVPQDALGKGGDPRKTRKFDARVLQPNLQRDSNGNIVLGYKATKSKMTLACGYRHEVEGSDYEQEVVLEQDMAKTVMSFEGKKNQPIRITKYVTYHSSAGVPTSELADRCERTLQRAVNEGIVDLHKCQKHWLDQFWDVSDVEIEGPVEEQQAIRWNLFQLAQASARVQEQGIAAKAVTGGGYEGHYFWDTEIYVTPFLAYTQPDLARKVLRFRWKMLGAARQRAADLSENGALFPWRTINGEEASAYYAAGTAQYHINAAVCYAIKQYIDASGDQDFWSREAAEVVVETARLWADLGFFGRDELFHIHRVTGPDEYTTVVNDNFYTNAMAQFNLEYAADTVIRLSETMPDEFGALQRLTGVSLEEARTWSDRAGRMYIPFDDELGIYPQDSSFLELEKWDFEGVPAEKYPLLLNFHPLVIYRHQVLKQADVVLAMYLLGPAFSHGIKRRNFEYYDGITTGDSSLSPSVQSMVAAEVGHQKLAESYFYQALYLDLLNLHHNTEDGVHIASAGGVWAGVVFGFAGFTDLGDRISFKPRLPSNWDRMTFTLFRHGSKIRFSADDRSWGVEVLDGDSKLMVDVDGEVVDVAVGSPLTHTYHLDLV